MSVETVAVDLEHIPSGAIISMSCPVFPHDCAFIEASKDYWETSTKLLASECENGANSALKAFLGSLNLEPTDSEVAFKCGLDGTQMRVCKDGEYIRFTHNGEEVSYWDQLELEEDAEDVLGAVLGKAIESSEAI